ncbi:hypothetical protein ZWY2020_041756 [Hordeum vulgare]|nr:hypothetical protein ZWY2020_041756 [Hordeum vulgare]
MPLERFDLRIASRELVRASDPPPGFPAVHAVSNLDLVLGPFPIHLVSIYPPPPRGLGPVLAAVRAALPAYLSRFFPFAGRVVRDPDTNIPEVACDNAGAELVVADAAGVPLAAVDFARVDRSLGMIQIPFDPAFALSLQVVRFACGGFALTVATNHLLADGRAFVLLLNCLAEMVRGGGGGLSRGPLLDRSSLLAPRSPPVYGPSLDAEFARFTPATMINPLLAAAMERRLYRIDAADLVALQNAASSAGRRTSRFVALCAHVWKLLARAVGDSDPNCRMAWIVDGRKCVEPSEGALDMYMGNVVTYTSREAPVAELLRAPLQDVAAAARAAMASVTTRDRFQELVDWVEANKTAYKDGGKWTEAVNLGLGSPALVISGRLPVAIDGDLGFGKPRLVLPWLRHGRLGSASVTVVPCPGGDGSWFVGGTRLWPRLVEVVENVPESLLKPVTAASLGFEAPHGSRL